MSDLHARLVAEIARYDGAMGTRTLVAALRAVVELHGPQETYPPEHKIRIGYTACTGCQCEGYEWEYPAYPCSTIQAIARELDVPTEGDDHRG